VAGERAAMRRAVAGQELGLRPAAPARAAA
jgi:hypothetical protein